MNADAPRNHLLNPLRKAAIALLAAASAATSLNACTSLLPQRPAQKTRLSIPDLANAEEQFAYAVKFVQNTFPGGTPEIKKDQRNQFRQLYQRVVDRYPDDRVHTPAARLLLADLDRDDNELNKALAQYRQIQADYPDLTYTKVRARFSEADILDRQKKYDDAKAIHHEIMTNYAASAERGVPAVVARARQLYFTVRKDAPERKRDQSVVRGQMRL